MKSPTGELLRLHDEASAKPERSGFTGALELYDELINFLGLSPEGQPLTAPTQARETLASAEPVAPLLATLTATTLPDRPAPLPQPANLASEETSPAKWATNSDALSQSEDVIRVTGTLVDFIAAKTLGSATIVCTDCGNASDSGEMFCIHCGGLLEEPAAEVGPAMRPGSGPCDDCGALVESDEIFCPSCGSVIASA